jgi:hypothetical protein
MTWGNTAGRVGIKLRDKHPLKHNTPLGLRRICGNCRHFDGHQTSPGWCSRHILDAHGLQSGRDCADWARPDPVAEIPKAPPINGVAYVAPRHRKTYDASNRRKVTDEQLAAIRHGAAQGLSIREVGEAMGVKYWTVRYIAEMYAVRFSGRGGDREGLRRNDEIRAALTAGEDRASIAERFGVTREQVKKVAQRMRAKAKA